ncbi:hypothetical protein HMPREF9439_02428 [Parasutterella excrementihominis YIT 11859]|uniref:Uncharacterized protein n=1 Tax=Parasutterella excrementihominis YIT 11859 TaxID=762966 RepID=F3QN97_9BURK|nr:hypothetical protein HMPREF9439_02428 [Parasutterella excrementihominis YIT 11859]
MKAFHILTATKFDVQRSKLSLEDRFFFRFLQGTRRKRYLSFSRFGAC